MAWTGSLGVSVGDATKESQYDQLAANVELQRDGSGNYDRSVAATERFNVDNGSTIWSKGWWQSSDGRWWDLGNTADATSFTRGDAEFYAPTGNILDVPLS
jgi:hypothetical protein